jgi:hypothetical protein
LIAIGPICWLFFYNYWLFNFSGQQGIPASAVAGSDHFAFMTGTSLGFALSSIAFGAWAPKSTRPLIVLLGCYVAALWVLVSGGSGIL